jgi:hypothetical protein
MAARLWRGHASAPEQVILAARTAAIGMNARPGKVESGGTFEERSLAELIRRALPAPLAGFLRAKMEWYGCRGAFFHNDAHYDDVLFGVWCILGPPRDLVFSRVAARVPAVVGGLAVFDPFEPHAVLSPGSRTYQSEDYEAADLSVFLGFEIELAPAVRSALGIGPPHAGAATYSSRIAIHPATGAAATAGA